MSLVFMEESCSVILFFLFCHGYVVDFGSTVCQNISLFFSRFSRQKIIVYSECEIKGPELSN